VTRPAAVVFDCDGVLADSEPHSVAAWLVVLEALGHPATRLDVEGCTGLGFVPTWERLSAVEPLPPMPDVWSRLLAALEKRFVDPGLARFPDAAAVLNRCLAESVPVAVVSASPRQRLDLTLHHSGLDDVFAVTVSGDDVERGKPAPDPYLLAAEGLGVYPATCVVIEDSPTGVAAALAAGCRVVAVVRDEALRPALESSGATVVDRLTSESAGL
jgi:beta-phosphoglucomutase-like phosphatase (HAD superfamily)